VRYLSDVVDGTPFLVAYRLLPGVQHPEGIAGLVVDLPRLSSAVLPRFLAELELSRDARLAIVDDAGRAVIGVRPDSTATVLTSSLGEPFEFWSVAVSGLAPQAVGALDVRTKAWLAAVAVLLFTIAAGAWLVVAGLRRQARLANLKTTFVSNVSHELRTPLASIRMYAEMLEMAGARLDAGEQKRQLAVIRSEAGRLERLIDAVLDFASLQRGTRRFRFEYDEIGPLVVAAAQSFRAQAESLGFAYRVEVEPDLPELRVDADAIREVLLNLLSNAVKYSDSDRSIVVRAYRRGDAVALEVEDRGIGIDPADHERIFEDFYRVDERLSTTRQGVGLGLTLARRIVEAHGGRIEVHSARGRGARFTVWLPAEPQPAAPPSGPVAQEAGS
jgi:signal transduction histidine kinase